MWKNTLLIKWTYGLIGKKGFKVDYKVQASSVPMDSIENRLSMF